MQDDYSWKEGDGNSSTYYTTKSESIWIWVFVALVFALILHGAAFWGFGRMVFAFSENVDEMAAQPELVRIKRMDFDEPVPEVTEPAPVAEQVPVEVEPPADELDMLEQVVDVDIDILPDVEVMQVPMSDPVMAGALEEEDFQPMQAPVFDPELPKMGLTDDLLPQSDGGELIVDPGSRMAEEYDPDEYTESLQKGAGGESDDGLFKEFTSLDQMTRMDGNTLLASKALIGSDLLFDFGSAALRQSARVSLMKVALLINKNPDLVCWVDGHTDLIGREDRNMILSQERAMAVKNWLVDTLALDPNRMAVSGYGKSNPLILSGTAAEQAANRRVEIKMRKGRPENETHVIEKLSDEAVAESPENPTLETPKPTKPETAPVAIIVDEKKAVIVKPKLSKADSLERLRRSGLPENQNIEIPSEEVSPVAIEVPESISEPWPSQPEALDQPALRPLPKFRDIPAIPLTEDLPLPLDELELPEIEDVPAPRAILIEE